MIFDYRKHRASHGLGNLLRVFNGITRGIEVPVKVPDYPPASPWARVLVAGGSPPENSPGRPERLPLWARAIA